MKAFFRFRRRRGIRGVVLITALFFMVLIGLIAFAFMDLVPSELRTALFDVNRTNSYYIAYGSAQGLSSWLRTQEDLGNIPTSGLTVSSTPVGDPVNWPKDYVVNQGDVPGLITTTYDHQGNPDSSWSESAILSADANTAAGLTPHIYKFHVQLYRYGLLKFTADYILQQQTFAKYGFFVNNYPGFGEYQAGPLAAGGNQFYGEFHINGPMPLEITNNLFGGAYTPMAAPIHGLLTFTQATANAGSDGVAYQTAEKPFNGVGTENTVLSGGVTYGDYSIMCTKGKPAIQQVPQVSMPQTDTTQVLPIAKGAYFGRNSFSDTFPATIPASVNLPWSATAPGSALSGIYIKGDVRQMQLNVAASFSPVTTPFSALKPNNTPRDATGLISTGDPYVVVKEEATQSANTTVVEMRDSGVSVPVPVGAKVYDAASNSLSVSAGASITGTNKTIVIREANAGNNTAGGATDRYEIYPGFPNGAIFVDGNIGKNSDLPADNYKSLTTSPYTPTTTPELPSTTNPPNPIDLSSTPRICRDYYVPTGTSAGGLSGLNYGAERTIAVNITADNYIRLDGTGTLKGLQRGDIALGAQPNTSRRDGLGVVGYDVIVGQENHASALSLYCLLMAGRNTKDPSNPLGDSTSGSVIYENFNAGGGYVPLNVYGSYVVGYDRTWAINSGWQPSFYWDGALSSSPPPFYPTQSDYSIQAYKEYQ